jgi:hypothetical protein
MLIRYLPTLCKYGTGTYLLNKVTDLTLDIVLGWFLRRTASVDVGSEGVGIHTVVQRAEQEAVFTRLLWQVLSEIFTIRYLPNRF